MRFSNHGLVDPVSARYWRQPWYHHVVDPCVRPGIGSHSAWVNTEVAPYTIRVHIQLALSQWSIEMSAMKVLTITLNAAIDATYVVARFEPGGANRVIRKHTMPGGKGNNVARVLAACGHEVVATGFLGGESGTFIEQGLQDAGIETRFTWLDKEESRTCHTVLDRERGEATEILEAGPEVSGDDCERLLEAVAGLIESAPVVVISGSAPIGATPEFLERLANLVRTGSSRMVVDSSGRSLEALLAGRPDLIAPNEAEIRALMGRPGSLAEQVDFARDDLIGRRMAPGGRVMISRGRAGALLVSNASVLEAVAPVVTVVNTVGCGDALLAGILDGWAHRLDDQDWLRQAVAFGTAAALQEVAGVVEMRDVEALRPDIDVVERADSSPQVTMQ
jgi:1-phosphofructokinase family hexose kinase